MKDSKSKSANAPKLPKFQDLLPNLTTIGPVWVSHLLVEFTRKMVLLAKAKITAKDKKSIMSELDAEFGSGIISPLWREVVALITQISKLVADGNDPSKLSEYVNVRFTYAAYKHGSGGRNLLEWVVVYLKEDLLDCEAETVFHRRRAA